MQITFMVGNGFDLNLGLRTGFSDFVKIYILPNDDDSINITGFKEMIQKDLKRWSDAEWAFGQYTALFHSAGKSADDFYECYDDFCEKLANYLDAQEQRLEFEGHEDLVAKAFSKAINIDSLFRHFSAVQSEQLTNAVKGFPGGYTYNFIDYNYTSTFDNCFYAAKKIHGIMNVRHTKDGVHENSLSNLIHVHGNTSKNMVLGVNDTSQLAEVGLFEGHDQEYIDQMIKKGANALGEENNDKKTADLIASSDLFYVYGMSIGLTDKIWWQRILKRMIVHPSVHLIIHIHGIPESSLLPRKTRIMEKRKKEQFIELYEGKHEEEMKKSLMSRIHFDTQNAFSEFENMMDGKIKSTARGAYVDGETLILA